MNAKTQFNQSPAGAAARVPPGVDPLTPRAQGLYDPANEHNSCGVGFVADMKNRRSHDILEKGLQILANLDHRGAVGADPTLGDGCGVLTQIPHGFFAPECAKLGFDLPEPGHYAIGQFFMPRHAAARRQVHDIVEEVVAAEGQTVLGWRDVPVDNSALGERVKATEPVMQQIFIGRAPNLATENDFERRLYIIRKVISKRVYAAGGPEVAEYYPVSISCRTIIYKGMFLADQLGAYYPRPARRAISRARSRSCISASPPTRSRPGRWRTPIAWSRITARSTRCAAITTGWRRGRLGVTSRAVRQRHRKAVADLLRGPVRHRLLRQRARIPRPWAAIRCAMR